MRNLLVLFCLCTLIACGGGGDSGGTTAPLQGPAKPTTLAVTSSSIPANALGADPREGILFIFNGDLGNILLTPNLIQLTDGVNVVPIAVTAAGQTLTVTPGSALKLRTDYKLTMKAGFAGSASVLASDYVLSFKTDVVVFDTKQIVPMDQNLNTGVPPVIAAGDFNGDGRQDVVELAALQNQSSTSFPPVVGYTLNLYAQNAQGGFDKAQQIDYPIGASNFMLTASKVVLMDIDGDGVPEILVPEFKSTDSTDTGLRVFSRGTNGKYQATGFISSAYLQQLYVGDVDGDGRPDLIGGASGNYAAGFQVFLNEGSKSSLAPTGLLAMPVVDLPAGLPELAATSLNHDGSRQILVNTYRPTSLGQPLSTQMFVFSQGARGMFSLDSTLTHLVDNVCAGFTACVSMTVIDIDADGLPDLLFSDARPNSVAYVRRGNTFVKGFETQIGGFVKVADANGDGLSDLMIVSSGDQPFVAVAVGNRTTNFLYSKAYRVPLFNDINSGSAAAISDVNGDGLPDIVIDQVNSGIYVMLQHKY